MEVMNVNENIIFVGIPGAGKSTLSQRFKDSHIIINPDSIRKKLFGSESTQGPWGSILSEMVAQSLADTNKPILIDATDLQSQRREELLNYFMSKTKKFGWTAVWFDCPLEVALDRNSKRARKVPEGVITDMHKRLEAPTLDEGFGTVIHWSAVDNKVMAVHSVNPVTQLLAAVIKD